MASIIIHYCPLSSTIIPLIINSDPSLSFIIHHYQLWSHYHTSIFHYYYYYYYYYPLLSIIINYYTIVMPLFRFSEAKNLEEASAALNCLVDAAKAGHDSRVTCNWDDDLYPVAGHTPQRGLAQNDWPQNRIVCKSWKTPVVIWITNTCWLVTWHIPSTLYLILLDSSPGTSRN